jgi:hypothetical protein
LSAWRPRPPCARPSSTAPGGRRVDSVAQPEDPLGAGDAARLIRPGQPRGARRSLASARVTTPSSRSDLQGLEREQAGRGFHAVTSWARAGDAPTHPALTPEPDLAGNRRENGVHRDGMVPTGPGRVPARLTASRSSRSAAAAPGQTWSFQFARSLRPSTRWGGRRSWFRTSEGHGVVS